MKPLHGLVAPALLAITLAAPAAAEAILLPQVPRITDISYDPGEPDTVVAATFHGVFSIAPDGLAEPISPDAGALLTLIRDPQAPATLLASGYRSETEKLGVLRSDDGGRTWGQVTEGSDPVAFHAMAFSPVDPAIVYGVDEAIQVSRDGGRTWSKVARLPVRVFGIAVSASAPETLYLATMQGLFRSVDGGRSWRHAHPESRPATMVHVGRGRVHAFVYGLGLLSSADAEDLRWTTVARDFDDRALMDLAVRPDRPGVMLGLADTGGVMISRDRGRTWGSYEGQLNATPEQIEAGRKLYEDYCQECHGVRGVGERPEDMYATDENGLYVAPPLDNSAHAWHHSDEDLVTMILDGSERNPRMAAWKETGVTRADAESLVAYIKSLWSFRSLACQGPRHMSCMH